MKKLISLYLILIFFLFSCKKDEPEIPEYSMSENARYYLDFVFNIMEKNSIVRNNIDWTSFRKKYYKQAENAQFYSDTYLVIFNACRELHPHSFFMTPSSVTTTYSKDDSSIIWPSAKWYDGIAYLKVPGFSGSTAQANKFANILQDSIRSLDSKNPKGWIVDLMNNTGGNMYPMIAGIGPLLDRDTLGYFIYPDNNSSVWRYKNGSSFYEENVYCTVNNPYFISNRNVKVAVLQNSKTASSGEATLISFIANYKTKRFGTESAGYSTGNRSYYMPDNAMLVLTTCYMADRNKTKYGSKINPDIFCTENEAIIQATNWINE